MPSLTADHARHACLGAGWRGDLRIRALARRKAFVEDGDADPVLRAAVEPGWRDGA